MGTVYRARDTRLRRDVALKVLPEDLRLSPARLARYEQEARIVAALNHPNIAAIYGIEEEAGGIQALVLELVEGKSLGARIAEGCLTISEALDISRQIAQALDAAHEKGIVHRDLKPANVVLTATGLVKVLDFGIAEMTDASDLATDQTTITAGLTREGVLVGTPAYMSPEQARGQAVDRRTDIWAFGCVLYEMLAGRPLFEGRSATDTLATVLTAEPDWSALPPHIPSPIHSLLKRCLVRERAKRLGDIAAVRFALEDVSTVAAIEPTAPSVSRTTSGSTRTVAAVVAAKLAAFRLSAGRVELQVVDRESGRTRSARPMPADRTLGAIRWSPDGEWLAYQRTETAFSDRLLVVGALSGEAKEVARAASIQGFHWRPDGGLIYASSEGSTVLYPPIFTLRTVGRDGTENRPLTLGEDSYMQPDVDTRSGNLVATRVRMQSNIFKIPADGDAISNTEKRFQITRQTGLAQSGRRTGNGSTTRVAPGRCVSSEFQCHRAERRNLSAAMERSLPPSAVTAPPCTSSGIYSGPTVRSAPRS
jgi:serine/threonine protein kinase